MNIDCKNCSTCKYYGDICGGYNEKKHFGVHLGIFI